MIWTKVLVGLKQLIYANVTILVKGGLFGFASFVFVGLLRATVGKSGWRSV